MGLVKAGPRLMVAVSLSKQFTNAMVQAGKDMPAMEAKNGWALIDTGASNTCIDEAAASALNLPVVGQTKICSASHDATEKSLYPIYLEFLGHGVTFDPILAPGAPLAVQGLLALIGRDILSRCLLVYNGQMGMTTLATQ